MTIDSFLIAHGSALILPLSVIEGPVVSIATGFLSARQYFEWYWAFFLLVCGDLIGDMIYYLIGRSGLSYVARFDRRLAPALRLDLTRNATKMLFVGKWTHSIGWAVLIGAGMLHVPPRRFMLISLLATLPKTAVLFGLGYFFGENYGFFESHILIATVALCAAGAMATVLIFWRSGGILTDRNGR